MGTVADKLSYLSDTKADIRAAMIDMGLDVPTNTPFREYGQLIRTISGGAPPKKPLNDMTWEEISLVSKMGLAKEYFSVGDVKMIHVEGTVGNISLNNDFGVFILGIDHNLDYQMPGITFGCFKSALSGGKDICLVDDRYGTSVSNLSDETRRAFTYNISGDATYGWRYSKIRYLNIGSDLSTTTGASPETVTSPADYTLMKALPADLRAVMRPMVVCVEVDARGTRDEMDVAFVTEYLPLPSRKEVTGSGEGTYISNYIAQFDYYKSRSKTKYKHNALSSAATYWTRNQASTESAYVVSSGSTTTSVANYSYGISPMFLV